MMMVISATLIIILFMFLFSELYQDNLSDKKRLIMEDYSYYLQQEFILAATSHEGYYRVFTVPEKLDGFEYEANITLKSLLIDYGENVFELPIPVTQGNLVKGENTIRTYNGSILLNQ